MSTAYPVGIDGIMQLYGSDTFNSPFPSNERILNNSTAIQALETKVGVNNSTDPNSLDYKVAHLSGGTGTAINIKTFGAKGDGATDDTAAFDTAFAIGERAIYIPTGTYIVDGIDAITVDGLSVFGDGYRNSIIKLKDSRSGSGAILTLSGINNFSFSDIGIDGNWANNTSETNAGFVVSAVNGINIQRVKISYLNGVAWQGGSYYETAPTQNVLIRDCVAEEVLGGFIFGWYEYLEVSNNTVITCGGSCIMMAAAGTSGTVDYTNCHNKHIKIINNSTNKAQKPAYMSTTETGWFIGLSGEDEEVVCSGNDCFDNRNAAYDGIGTFPFGTEHHGVLISDNIVRFAGAYGIDACSNCVISNNIILEPILTGIAVLTDGLQDLENIIINGNLITNVGVSGGTAGQGIIIGFGSGSKTMKNIIISNNIIRDNRTPQYCTTGITINGTSGLVTDVNIFNNDLANVSSMSIYTESTGFSNIRTANNIMKYPLAPLSGATPSVLGQNDFVTSNGSDITVTALTNGYDSQIIHIMFGDAHTTFNNGATFGLTTASLKGSVLSSITFQYNLANTRWVEIARGTHA